MDKLDALILSGKYYEILDQLEKFLKNKKISTKDKIRAKILKGKAMLYLGSFDFILEYQEKAIDVLNEVYVESNNKQYDLLAYDAIYWKHLPLCLLNRYDEFLTTIEDFNRLQVVIKSKYPSLEKLFDARSYVMRFFENAMRNYNEINYSKSYPMNDHLQCLKINVDLEDLEEIGLRYRQLAINCSQRGDYEQSLHYWNKALKHYLEMGNKLITANCCYNIARTYKAKGDLDQYYRFLKKTEKEYNELKSKRGIAHTNLFFGDYFKLKGEREKAAECFEKSLQFYQETDDKMMTGWSLNNCGEIYQQKGELNNALDCFKKAFRIFLELGKPIYIHMEANTNSIHFNISVIHYLKGEFDNAIEIRKELLELSRKEQLKNPEAIYLTSLAEVFLQKGMIKEANKYVKESLVIREEIGDKLGVCHSLYLLSLIAIEKNDAKSAKKYLEQLQLKVNELKSKPWNQYYQYLKALVLKMSESISKRIQAEVLLEQLLEEELDYKLLVDTLFSICELLIFELKESGEKKILEKIHKFVIELHNLAKMNNSYSLIIETLRLQSQLALLELEVEKAKNLLSQANIIAKERGLERLRLKISNDIMKVDNKSLKLNKLKEKTLPKKMEIMKLVETVTDIKKERLTDFMIEESIKSTKLFSLKL
ncbi:MAG: tetratricopeptide repeat protein [Candidatus Heimdallarchaeota archaeon]